MPNRHTTLTSLFTDIAGAIRSKTGDSAEIKADDFDTAIEAIPTGGQPVESDDYFYVGRHSSVSPTDPFSVQLSGKCIEDLTITKHAELSYSFDKQTWFNVTRTGSIIYIDFPANVDKVYFKNNNNIFNYYENDTIYDINIKTTKSAVIGGTLGSLLNDMSNNYIYPYAFYKAFKNFTYLRDVHDLKLPNNSAPYSYNSMFSSCSYLTNTPKFNFKSVASYSCESMFNGCRNLNSISYPIILNWIETYGTASMFYICSELQEADTITINNVVSSYACYNMFTRCSKLSKAPKLNATSISSYCYSSMFEKCISLTETPELPALNIASYCYNYMFLDCNSLTTIHALPATKLSAYCYGNMFQNCTSLTHVPALPATKLEYGCYSSMFSGCTSLKVYAASGEGHTKAWNIPRDGVITGSTNSQSNMFKNVETDSVPANFPATKDTQFTYYTEFDPVE